ncbi:hypothetical protein ACMHYB_09970 [Sorangium sp. So ce1128]
MALPLSHATGAQPSDVSGVHPFVMASAAVPTSSPVSTSASVSASASLALSTGEAMQPATINMVDPRRETSDSVDEIFMMNLVARPCTSRLDVGGKVAPCGMGVLGPGAGIEASTPAPPE